MTQKMATLHEQKTGKPLSLTVDSDGSIHEGTKVGLPDEYDLRICVDDLRNIVTVRQEGQTYNLHINHGNYRHLSQHPLELTFGAEWQTQGGDNINIHILYDHLYQLMCKALSDSDIYRDVILCYKFNEKEQIHLEWQGDEHTGMAIKVDIVFAVEIDQWVPFETKVDSVLLEPVARECFSGRLLVTCKTLKPSFSEQEGKILKNMPSIPKVAYCLSKIINSLLVFSKEQLPYRVKTYDLKNAVLYKVDNYLKDNGIYTMIRYYESHDKVSAHGLDLGDLYEYDDLQRNMSNGTFMRKVCEWTRELCDQGLRRLMTDGCTYYFGIGRTRINEAAVVRLCRYVDVVLGLPHGLPQQMTMAPGNILRDRQGEVIIYQRVRFANIQTTINIDQPVHNAGDDQ